MELDLHEFADKHRLEFEMSRLPNLPKDEDRLGLFKGTKILKDDVLRHVVGVGSSWEEVEVDYTNKIRGQTLVVEKAGDTPGVDKSEIRVPDDLLPPIEKQTA